MFKDFPAKYTDAAKLVLRIAVAAAFLYHGTMKWGMLSMPAAPEGMSAAMFTIFKILAIAEPLAGIALLLGFLTRIANIGLIIIMLGAIFVMKGGFSAGFSEGFGKWELDFLLLSMNVALFLMGPGKWSLDKKMMSKK